MTKPLVSVIIPVYNHERFVSEAITSVTRQSYRPIELIVIDDGSTDRSAVVAKDVLRRTNSQSIFIQRENRGAHNTLNQGLSLATGDYIAILNSDDRFHVDRLSYCVDTALRMKAEFVFTGVNFIDENNEECRKDEYITSLLRTEALVERYPTLGFAFTKNQIAISTGNFFFSRRICAAVGGFRHYKYVHDWDFVLRALFFCEPVWVRDKMYHYRLHGDNSFKSLSNIEGYETTEVMRNFLRLMTSRVPENPIAPCPHYWPAVFNWFIKTLKYEVYMPADYFA